CPGSVLRARRGTAISALPTVNMTMFGRQSGSQGTRVRQPGGGPILPHQHGGVNPTMRLMGVASDDQARSIHDESNRSGLSAKIIEVTLTRSRRRTADGD